MEKEIPGSVKLLPKAEKNKDVYVKLVERLNKNQFKFPPINPVLNFLAEVYTPEQAELGADFPLGAHTLKSLSEQLGRDENESAAMIQEMEANGLIFYAETESGEKEYSLAPFVVGLFEHQYLKGDDTEMSRKTSKYLRQIGAETKQMVIDAHEQPLPQDADIYQLRTLTIEEELLDTSVKIPDWEQISKLLDQEESFAAGACACRAQKEHAGDPCKIENVPTDTCIYFGKVADYYVEQGICRRYSRQEVEVILKSCQDAGLIMQTSNFVEDGNLVLCNCCGCCCDFLNEVKMFGNKANRIIRSNFMPRVSSENCIACGECIDTCQMQAIEMDENTDVIIIDEKYCIGCGNCASKCPAEAISMVRTANAKPPKKRDIGIVGIGR